MGLQRAFERRLRYEAGLDQNPHPRVLDKFNDSIEGDKGVFLHPRKGFRSFSMKRSRAGLLTAEQRVGKFPPMIIALQSARMFILTGRYS